MRRLVRCLPALLSWLLVLGVGVARADVYSIAPADPQPVAEGSGDAHFLVTRVGDLGAGSVSFQTEDGTGTGGPSGAQWPDTYRASRGTVRFSVGQSRQPVRVPLVGANLFDPDRSFSVRLSDPSGDGIEPDRLAVPSASVSVHSAAADPCSAPQPAGEHDVSITVGDHTQPVRIYVPPGLPAGRAVPVLVALHGYRGTGTGMESYSGLSALARRERFIVAYPTAPGGIWRFHQVQAEAVGDVDLIRLTFVRLERTVCADTAREFLVGVSNGGGMALRAGCDLAGRLAGLALVAGDYHRPAPCRAARALSVLEIHGQDDPVAPYGGLPNGLGGSVYSVLALWRGIDLCAGNGEHRRLDRSTFRALWSCPQSTIVRALRIVHFAHGWPGDDPRPGTVPDRHSGAGLVWSFLSQLPPRPPLPGS